MLTKVLCQAHLWVLDEALQAVYKVGAIEGVTPDAHHCRLTQALDSKPSVRL
jgi:hypothetical protein